MAGLLAAGGLRLLKAATHSDFMIECKGTQFKVHKGIIATASQFFESCIDDDFKEGKEGVLRFPTDEPIIIAAVVAFIYTGELDTLGLKSIWPQFAKLQIQDTSTFDIRTLTQVYVLADRLMMDHLRSVALKQIVGWNGPISTNKRGWQVDLLKAVYELTPEGDPIRIEITFKGMNEQTSLYNTGKEAIATKILDVMKEHEPVATGLAMKWKFSKGMPTHYPSLSH